MQKIKKGFIKNIVSVLLAVTLAFPITLFAGCGLKSSDYTEKEHYLICKLKGVRTIIKKRKDYYKRRRRKLCRRL